MSVDWIFDSGPLLLMIDEARFSGRLLILLRQ